MLTVAHCSISDLGSASSAESAKPAVLRYASVTALISSRAMIELMSSNPSGARSCTSCIGTSGPRPRLARTMAAVAGSRTFS